MASTRWYDVDVSQAAVGPLDDVVSELFPERPSPWESAPASIAIAVEPVQGAELAAASREPWRVITLGSVRRSVDEQIDALVRLEAPRFAGSMSLVDPGGSLPLALVPLAAPLPPPPVTDLNEELFLALVGSTRS